MKLFIEEIDKIGFGQEQFTRTELWLIDCKKHIAKISRSEMGNAEAERAKQNVLTALQELRLLLEAHCARLSEDLDWVSSQ